MNQVFATAPIHRYTPKYQSGDKVWVHIINWHRGRIIAALGGGKYIVKWSASRTTVHEDNLAPRKGWRK